MERVGLVCVCVLVRSVSGCMCVWLVLVNSKVEGEGSRRGDVAEVGGTHHRTRLWGVIVHSL